MSRLSLESPSPNNSDSNYNSLYNIPIWKNIMRLSMMVDPVHMWKYRRRLVNHCNTLDGEYQVLLLAGVLWGPASALVPMFDFHALFHDDIIGFANFPLLLRLSSSRVEPVAAVVVAAMMNSSNPLPPSRQHHNAPYSNAYNAFP